MEPIEILKKYYDENSECFRVLLLHSRLVAKKALDAASKVPHLNPDMKFIEEAALLHDIGAFLTDAAVVHCHGKEPYIRHTVLGADILRKEGFPKHALVCERHIGVGITKEEIVENNLPLPARDLMPETIEEVAVSFADKFFTKLRPTEKRTAEEVKKSLAPHGEDKVKKFEEWLKLFGEA